MSGTGVAATQVDGVTDGGSLRPPLDRSWSMACETLIVLVLAWLMGLVALIATDAPIVAVMLVLCGVTGFALAYWCYGDLFSPIGISSAAWIAPLGVAEFRLSEAQAPYDPQTRLVLLIGTLSFALGCVAAAIACRLGRRQEGAGERLTATSRVRRLWPRRLRLATGGLLILALVGYGSEAYLAGGVPILSDERPTAYMTFAQSYIHYLTVSTIAVGLLASVDLLLFGRRSLISVFFLVLSVGVLLTLLARLQVLMIALGYFVVRSCLKKQSSLRLYHCLVLLLLGILSMNAFAVLRSGERLVWAQEIGGMSLPYWANFLAWPYLYLSLNFEQLNSLVILERQSTNGVLLFAPLLALTLTRRLFPLPDYTEQLGWYNTPTYLWSIYSDFQILGVVFVPFVYAAGATFLYHMLRTRRSPGLAVIYSLVVFCLLLMFFENFFAFPLMYILGLEVLIVLRLASRPVADRPALPPR